VGYHFFGNIVVHDVAADVSVQCELIDKIAEKFF